MSNNSKTDQAGKRITQADEMTAALVEDIVSGLLKQGSRISEPALSKSYGIGRGPLREAILRLEGMGLVVREPHVGARVVRLNHQELSDIFSMREALEGVAAREAAENIAEEELIDLGQLIDRHARYVEENNGESYMDQEGDYDFHYRIIKASGNRRLIQLLCNELYHLVRIYRKSSKSEARPDRALIEHKMIFQALQDRDGELAELLMRKHIGRARREIENAIEH